VCSVFLTVCCFSLLIGKHPSRSLLLVISLMINVVFLWITCFVVACDTGLGTLVPKGTSDVRLETTPDTGCLYGYGIALYCFSLGPGLGSSWLISDLWGIY
jgi:hypothetical protein